MADIIGSVDKTGRWKAKHCIDYFYRSAGLQGREMLSSGYSLTAHSSIFHSPTSSVLRTTPTPASHLSISHQPMPSNFQSTPAFHPPEAEAPEG